MKQLLMIICAVVLPLTLSAQKFGLKTNVLYDATATINLGMEAGLGKKTTLDISGNYNGWTFGDDTRWRHWMVQPEFRYWLCERFNGHFFGLHGHTGEYNVGGFNFFGNTNPRHVRYQGHFWGLGISYGYQWILSNRWNLELTAGAGFARLNDKKYPLEECGEMIRHRKQTYWGPTKLGVSFIFMIK